MSRRWLLSQGHVRASERPILSTDVVAFAAIHLTSPLLRLHRMGNAKWTIPKLIAAGYSATDFKDAGLSAAAIRSLGFGEDDLQRAGLGGGAAYMYAPPRPQTGSARTRGSGVAGSHRAAARPGTAGLQRPATAAPPRAPRGGTEGAEARAGGAARPAPARASPPPRPRSASEAQSGGNGDLLSRSLLERRNAEAVR